MRQASSRSRLRQIVAGLLFAGLCAPAPMWADEPSGDAEAAPVPTEPHWYDSLVHNTDIGFDLLIVRPFAGLTAGVGAILFVPAAIMTAPNGKDSLKDAYERFVREPGEYFISRPLGEF
jgi:hypothetical protein